MVDSFASRQTVSPGLRATQFGQCSTRRVQLVPLDFPSGPEIRTAQYSALTASEENILLGRVSDFSNMDEAIALLVSSHRALRDSM